MESVTKASELLQAQTHVWNHTFNFVTSMSLKCAIQLGIPEAVQSNGGSITLPELVTALGICPKKSSYLQRLMRLLVQCGFFSLSEKGDNIYYSLTVAGRFLIKGDQHYSGAAFALLVLDPVLMAQYHEMSTWFRSDKDDTTVFSHTYGKQTWEFMADMPNMSTLFNEGMASDSCLVAEVVVKECKDVFEGVKSLVDIGGGIGIMVKAIAAAFPQVDCTVLDLSHVVAGLEDSGNVKYIAGDMFEFVPPADAILLKWILHDWEDEPSLKILKKCKEAVTSKGKSGKVIIIDMVLDDESLDEKSKTAQYCFDVGIMVSQKGMERTEKEWDKLFSEAGFTRYQINKFLGTRAVIEVYP
ncbi:Trans-resveratrol di-O-methyltransferase [Linum perenne]